MKRRKLHSLVSGIAIASVILCAVSTTSAGTASGPFLRGDVNGSGVVDIADAVAALAFLFSGGAAPACHDAADTNDDGAVNLADPIATLAYLFSGGGAPPLPSPFPAVGYDPTVDALPCTPVDCLLPTQLAAALALGTVNVSVPTPAVDWSPSVAGVGLFDVVFNMTNTIPVEFGPNAYDPATGIITLAPSSFPVGSSLDIDGPLFLDFSCSVTITVGLSGSFTLEQAEASPELIFVSGVDSTSIDLSLQGISLGGCGLPGYLFDLVYPLISGYVGGVVNNAMQSAVAGVAGNFMLGKLVDLFEGESNTVAVCAP